jgi:hypothetical protein
MPLEGGDELLIGHLLSILRNVVSGEIPPYKYGIK